MHSLPSIKGERGGYNSLRKHQYEETIFGRSSRIRQAEPALADYVFAKRLERNGLRQEELLAELRPATDGGVVILQEALRPLLLMNHLPAAHVGRRILRQASTLLKQSESQQSPESLSAQDMVRGRIALLMGEAEIHELVMELQAEDAYVRSRAAYALKPVINERPESVQREVCEAIRQEQDGQVMNRLLWSVYRLEEMASDMLLDALEASFALNWHEPLISSGMALGILADVAEHRASRVLQLLPECLDAYKSWTHALLSEMLAYAWWKCAEFVPAAYAHKARAHLNSLFEPDLTNVSTEYHLFALRGAAIAQLGAICLDLHLPSSALSGRQTAYPLGTLQFFYLNLSDFITAHADTIKTHPHYL